MNTRGRSKEITLIEEVLMIENPALLAEVETVIFKSKMHAVDQKGLKDFVGIRTAEEADEMIRIIEESCE